MLILTRRKGQNILIKGDEIRIEVLSVKEDKVKLGIKAPKLTRIERGENYKNPMLTNECKSTINE